MGTYITLSNKRFVLLYALAFLSAIVLGIAHRDVMQGIINGVFSVIGLFAVKVVIQKLLV